MTPSIVVIHYTAMADAGAAIQRLCDPQTEVSAHYVISRQGESTRLVDEDQRAWHAGAGEWRGKTDVNSHAIGIELDNTGTHPFPEPQMSALEDLLATIMTRWSILPENIIGHSDMAPGRKADPGPRFDWQRLARRGLAAVTGTASLPKKASPELFRRYAQDAGFTAQVDDDTLLTSVRLRHRPHATGPLTAADIAALKPRAAVD